MKHRYIIPNKLYFRIGEVSELVGVKPYVLRYWETEFGEIKPAKSKSGQRLYKKRDVELLLMIRELLHKQRYTINGAKKKLKELCREKDEQGHAQIPLQLERMSLHKILSKLKMELVLVKEEIRQLTSE